MQSSEPAEETIEILKRSYLYLRLSLVGVVGAIFLALWFTPGGFIPDGDSTLRSISHYYYSPARIVFTAALCAAALALVAISGKGVQSHLLDFAALLAPLIAIIPTRTLVEHLGAEADLGRCIVGWEEVAPLGADGTRVVLACIPADQLPYVTVGFWVWVTIAAAVLVVALIRGIVRRATVGVSYWVMVSVGAVVVGLYVLAWSSPGAVVEHEWLQMYGHFTAAGAFFVIITIVAVMEAVRQWFGRHDVDPWGAPRKVYAVVYLVLAAALAAVIVSAVVVIWQEDHGTDIGNAVLVIEIVGLVAFALFWVVQTLEHLNDADGWVSPPPPSEIKDTMDARKAERAAEAAAAAE